MSTADLPEASREATRAAVLSSPAAVAEERDLALQRRAIFDAQVDVAETSLHCSPFGKDIAEPAALGTGVRGGAFDRVEDGAEPAVGLFDDRAADSHELAVGPPKGTLAE